MTLFFTPLILFPEVGYTKRESENETFKQSLADKPKQLLVIYNRIPKTGSTTFANVAYTLAARNHFSVVHVNITRNSHILSLRDQQIFCQNVTTWSERLPALFHGHFAFINFDRLGCSNYFQHFHPVYINIVRDPIDRLISYFYFLRHGDDFRPGLKRRKAGKNDTFDECVAAGSRDCEPRLLWKQIPFFCGQSADCWEPGNPWALEQAKSNLVNNYLAVGTLDQMRQFVRMMEIVLPHFFQGAFRVLDSGQMGGDHLRKTTTKYMPSNATLERFKKAAGNILRLENDFYNFAHRHFDHAYVQLFGPSTIPAENVSPLESLFHFEKIRPKRPMN